MLVLNEGCIGMVAVDPIADENQDFIVVRGDEDDAVSEA